ncbi:MAG: 3'-5' exonuclease [Kiritimatiellae bacterium]|nr:3'-5' exonuclease [Kiritimatiellia bacterium]
MTRKLLSNLTFDRPLAFFDLETTGINVRTDRIVEIAVVKVLPGGEYETIDERINPTVPIPPETTAIHGITDADVANCPTFAERAQHYLDFLEGCDLAGYNLNRFDVPLLAEEFLRVGMTFEAEGRRIVDAQTIFHKREPRDLSAALRFYCGEMEFENAHSAEADVMATIRVVEGQLDRYGDLPHDVAGLDDFCSRKQPDWADRTGRLKWANNEVVLNFGKKKGTSLRYVIDNEPSFIKWMLRSDFPRDTLNIVERAMVGEWPDPPQK